MAARGGSSDTSSVAATSKSKKAAPKRAPAGDAAEKSPASEKKRKDRLIQTRVPRDLESTLKAEAKRRRLTVSHLIRNVLEDTFELVDGVVADVDQIVTDSVSLARNMSRNARRLASSGQGLTRDEGAEQAEPTIEETDAATETGTDTSTSTSTSTSAEIVNDDPLAHVYAWNEVVMHKPSSCSSCGRCIERGEAGYTGLSDAPDRPRAWLCESCIQQL